jgi:hybrid cluster-associated redox disulfide protein
MEDEMRQRSIDDMSLEEIMTRWPQTVGVFVNWRLHCVGCPIADFHQLADSAEEHGYDLADLRQAVEAAIDTGAVNGAAPPRGHQRSAAGGVDP